MWMFYDFNPFSPQNEGVGESQTVSSLWEPQTLDDFGHARQVPTNWVCIIEAALLQLNGKLFVLLERGTISVSSCPLFIVLCLHPVLY